MSDAVDGGLTLPPRLSRSSAGSAITVGTFDGVHPGHRAVLDVLTRRAESAGARSVLVTFEPHPLYVVRPEAAPPLLTTASEKKEALATTGLDLAVFLAFNQALSHLSPRDFVQRILVDRLGLTELVVGYDHGLGRGRSGDVETLRRLGRELDFRVHVVPPIRAAGDTVSSTRIRRALQDGRVDQAARALGRAYSLRGTVVRGAGDGRALGFPTANLRVHGRHKLLPRAGIYAVRARLRGRRVAVDEPLDGVMHLGPRPTFRDRGDSLEVHLFDFGREIYGDTLEVAFVRRLRAIERFDTTDQLIAAMHDDARAARAALTAAPEACP